MVDESLLQLVDTHCHLNFNLFDQDRETVLENARRNGIVKILIPGLDIETSQQAIHITHMYPGIFAAVGIHPNEYKTWSGNNIQQLKALALDTKVVAIGEIGLDYYRNPASKTDQLSIFKQQLELAAELNLPVIIHNRDASDDIYHLLHDWHSSMTRCGLELAARPGVLHSYSGDRDFADRAVDLNFKIGISGPITFRKKAEELCDIVRESDIGNLLLETDSPFLTPHPFRGSRNEPANVRIVAEKVANITGHSLDHIAMTTTATANKLFRWSDAP